MKAPYGSWRSPITASRIAEGAVSLGWPQAVGAALYWVEMRPNEGGRYVVVRRAPGGLIADVTPAGVNARTLVHEYGGGMYEAFATAAGAGARAGGKAGGGASGGGDDGRGASADGAAGDGAGEAVVFSAFDDQRLYRQDLEDDSRGGSAARWSAPRPLTAEPPAPRAFRYSDGRATPDRRLFFSVRERHLADEVVNDLVVLPAGDAGEPAVVASGHDFFSSPRLSPDGRLLAGLCWDHPNMPWDGTELWVARLDEDGRQTAAVRLAGGEEESVVQPLWAPDGGLLFVSDRSGWWNLYRIEPDELAVELAGAGASPGAHAPATAPQPSRPAAAPGLGAALLPMEAEFAKPQWVFGVQNAAFLPDGRLAAFCTRDDRDRIVVLEPHGGARELDCELTSVASIVAVGDRLGVVGGGPTLAARVALVDPETGDIETVRSSLSWAPAPAYLSVPRAIEFPTAYEPGSVTGPLTEEIARLAGDGAESEAVSGSEAAGEEAVSAAGAAAPAALTAHALYYAPHNPDVEPPAGERPPLLVISHGGPTSAAESTLSLSIQFWTSRGFAVVDVNYGGSSGHGRAYRDRLKGNWGIVDTIDCINAARHLVARGDADPARLAVRGGSAGGYTTLNALTRHDVFAAGASYFGLADLEMFVAGGTHKFEERYLIRLVGPYPERADVYRERSPIRHVDDIRCPVIVLQGLEDAIVPPAQAEVIVAALRRNRLPYAYLAFEGEQHGFRKAENIVRSLEAELSFYGQVFGFAPADEIEPPEVQNLDR